MKKYIVFLSAVVLLSIYSCKKEAVPEVVKTETTNEVTENCYQGIQGNDTVSMTLVREGNQLKSGKLSYHYFEKDKNDGHLEGVFRGDTLIADYHFQSEGMQSVREVIFLKRGKSYLEGFGPVDEQNGKVVFQNLKAIQFNDALPLKAVPCKN